MVAHWLGKTAAFQISELIRLELDLSRMSKVVRHGSRKNAWTQLRKVSGVGSLAGLVKDIEQVHFKERKSI